MLSEIGQALRRTCKSNNGLHYITLDHRDGGEERKEGRKVGGKKLREKKKHDMTRYDGA